jgi:hypothetical protein
MSAMAVRSLQKELAAQGRTQSGEVAELRGEVVALREELAAGVAKGNLMLEQLVEISSALLAKLAGESFIEPLRMVRAAREEEEL